MGHQKHMHMQCKNIRWQFHLCWPKVKKSSKVKTALTFSEPLHFCMFDMFNNFSQKMSQVHDITLKTPEGSSFIIQLHLFFLLCLSQPTDKHTRKTWKELNMLYTLYFKLHFVLNGSWGMEAVTCELLHFNITSIENISFNSSALHVSWERKLERWVQPDY